MFQVHKYPHWPSRMWTRWREITSVTSVVFAHIIHLLILQCWTRFLQLLQTVATRRGTYCTQPLNDYLKTLERLHGHLSWGMHCPCEVWWLGLEGIHDWVCLPLGFKSLCPNPYPCTGTLKFYTHWTHLCCPKYLTLCTRKNLEICLCKLESQVDLPSLPHQAKSHLPPTPSSTWTFHSFKTPSCMYLLQQSDFHWYPSVPQMWPKLMWPM